MGCTSRTSCLKMRTGFCCCCCCCCLCCCLCRCLGLLSAKLLRLLQLRCSSSVTSFFHSQEVVLKNTGLLSSAVHAQCSLSNQNDCSRCAGALFASAGSSEWLAIAQASSRSIATPINHWMALQGLPLAPSRSSRRCCVEHRASGRKSFFLF